MIIDPLPLWAWLIFYPLVSGSLGLAIVKLGGDKRIGAITGFSVLVASWFRDPPAL